VRVEVLDGRYLYAIRIVRDRDANFNLCRRTSARRARSIGTSGGRGSRRLPAGRQAGARRPRLRGPRQGDWHLIRLTLAASTDVGGGGVPGEQGRRTSIITTSTPPRTSWRMRPAAVGFERTERFVGYIVDVARGICQWTWARR